MTTLEQESQKQLQPDTDQKSLLHHSVRRTLIMVAILCTVLLCVWLWQNGFGSTLNSLPIVESIQGNATQNNSEFAPLGQEANADGTGFAQGRANRGNGTGQAAFQRQAGAQAGNLSTESAVPMQQNDTSNVANDNGADTGDDTILPDAEVAMTDDNSEREQETLSAGIVAIVGTNDVPLLSDEQGEMLETLPPGTPLRITHRSEDNEWLYVDIDGYGGWIEAAAVLAFGTDDLPTMPLSFSPESSAIVDELSNDVSQIAISDESTTVEDNEEVVQISTGPDLDRDGVDEVDTQIDDAEQVQPIDSMIGTVLLTGSRLNVRSAPTGSSTIIAKVYPDEEYTVLAQDESGDWLQIALSDDGFGWVSAEYMELNEGQVTLPISSEISNLPIFEEENAVGNESSVNNEAISTMEQTDVISAAAVDLRGMLAFRAENGLIHAYDLETGELWPVTDGFDPAISPDGSTIAFTRDGGESGLYVINMDGSGERLVYAEKEQLSAPKWSNDGSQILFTYRTDVLESSGRGRRGGGPQSPDVLESSGRVSRGGGPQSPEDLSNLAVININGEDFTDVEALDTARAADWTTSGIVYQSSAGIQLLDDLSDQESWSVAFEKLDPFDYDPDWQPIVDGSGGQIAFMKQGASHWEIYVVNPDGSGLTALTRPVTALVDALPSNVAPAYSPDGDHIVYLSNRGEDNSAGEWQIWVMDADGSSARPLPISVALDYTFGSEQAVSWGV